MNISIRKLAGLLAAVATLGVISTAQAQPANPSGPFAMAGSTQGYVGLNAGQTDYRLGNGTGLYGSDNRSTAYSIAGGAYFTNNIGVEVGYIDFGKVNRAGGTTRADGFNLSLIGKFPLGESFNLLGKIGTTYGRTDVSSGVGSGVTGGTDNGFGLSAGVGAEFLFNPKLSGVLQYEVHDLRFAGGTNDRDRVSLLTVGARYRF